MFREKQEKSQKHSTLDVTVIGTMWFHIQLAACSAVHTVPSSYLPLFVVFCCSAAYVTAPITA